jgi:hypothetical protein
MECPDCKQELNSRNYCDGCEREWDYVYLDGYWDGYEQRNLESIKSAPPKEGE